MAMVSGKSNQLTAVETTRNYCNSEEVVCHFYGKVWSGEDILVGPCMAVDETTSKATHRTVVIMAEKLLRIDANCHILDIGSGC